MLNKSCIPRSLWLLFVSNYILIFIVLLWNLFQSIYISIAHFGEEIEETM